MGKKANPADMQWPADDEMAPDDSFDTNADLERIGVGRATPTTGTETTDAERVGVSSARIRHER